METVAESRVLQEICDKAIKDLNEIGYFPKINGISFNSRLSKTYGRYEITTKRIEISLKMFRSVVDMQQVYDVVIHELTHNLTYLLYKKVSCEFQGHGSEWQSVAADISSKLGVNITRYSKLDFKPPVPDPLVHHYLVRCKKCGNEQTLYSKSATYEKARKVKCSTCEHRDWEYITKGLIRYKITDGVWERYIAHDLY